MLDTIINWLKPIIQNYGGWGVIFATFVEQVVPPIPSPLVATMAGFFLLDPRANLVTVLIRSFFLIGIPVSIGITLASLVYYYIGYIGGKPLIVKYKKILGVSWEDIEKVEKRLSEGKGDEFTLLFLRVLPIVPGVALSGVCGVLRYSIKTFTVVTLIGGFIRAVLLGLLGWYAGDVYETLADTISKIEDYGLMLAGGVILFFVGKYIYNKIKEKKLKTTVENKS